MREDGNAVHADGALEAEENVLVMGLKRREDWVRT